MTPDHSAPASSEIASERAIIESHVESSQRLWERLDSTAKRELLSAWRDTDLSIESPSSHLEQLLWVAIVGGTNVGKSTLFNLICGDALSPVSVTASATKYPLVYAPDRVMNHIEERAPLGPLTPCPHPETLITPLEVDPDDDRNQSPVYVTPHGARHKRPETGASADLLRMLDHIALVDCPDHDSIRQDNSEIALWVARRTDLCLYVTTPQKYKASSNIEVIMALLETGQEVWVLWNMLTPEQLSSLKVLWEDLRHDLDVSLGAERDQMLTRFKLAGGLPRVMGYDELPALQSVLHERLEFLEVDPPQARKRRKLVRSRYEHYRRLHSEVGALKTQRAQLIDLYIEALERSVMESSQSQCEHWEDFSDQIRERLALQRRYHTMRHFTERRWSLVDRIRSRSTLSSSGFDRAHERYQSTLFWLSSTLIQRWAPEHVKVEMRRDDFTLIDAHAYKLRITQLDQEERSWSRGVYTQTWLQVTRECHESASALKLSPERIATLMDAHLSATLEHEASERLSSTSLAIKTSSSHHIGWTSALMMWIAATSISGVMSWCVSWLLSSVFGAFMSVVIGVGLWGALGIALYDLIFILLIFSREVTQGSTLKELELQSSIQSRYAAHQVIWSALNERLRSILSSSQESGLDHLRLLEDELEHLTHLISDR